MLLLIGFVLFLAAASLMLLPLALRRLEVYTRYSGSRAVTCPENQQQAAVNINLRRAADSSIDGTPDLRLCDCTRWPERAQCAQQCLAQAVRPDPHPVPRPRPGARPIYHLPIAVAAFAAWCLGALWHSQYMFRARWTAAIGLTPAEIKQMVWWISPHLLTAAVCLLFAYGVAWLLALRHRRGVLQGILMSASLAAAVIAASAYSVAKLPHDLLRIEAVYLLAATLTVGAIVGGLYNKLVLPPE